MNSVNDVSALDVDLAGPECDLQDDDFQMLDEDVENSDVDDDLDSIPNLFRNRAALKATFTGSQEKKPEEDETTGDNAQGDTERPSDTHPAVSDEENVAPDNEVVEEEEEEVQNLFSGDEGLNDELLDYEVEEEDEKDLKQAEDEPELVVENEERFSDEEVDDNVIPSQVVDQPPLTSDVAKDTPEQVPPVRPSSASGPSRTPLPSPGNRLARTRGRARHHSGSRFETTTNVNPGLLSQRRNEIYGTDQLNSRIFNVHSPGLQAIRTTPPPFFNNSFPSQSSRSHQPALQRKSPTRSNHSILRRPTFQPGLQQASRRNASNGHSHSLVRNLCRFGQRYDQPLPKPHFRDRSSRKLPMSSHSLQLNPASCQMPVDLNAKPTCELGDFSSLTNQDNSHSGSSSASSRSSSVVGRNSVFQNRNNPEPVNPFSSSSDLRLQIESKEQAPPSRVSSKLGANFSAPAASSSRLEEPNQSDDVQMKDVNGGDSDDDDITVEKVVIEGTAYIETVAPKLEHSTNPESIEVIDLSSDDDDENGIKIGPELYPDSIRPTTERITELTAKALEAINQSQPVVPPEVMRGHIDNPKFRKFTSGDNLKRRRGPGDPNDLRQHLIAKKPRLPKRLCVVVENLPDKIYGDVELVRLLAESFGLVNKVTFNDETSRSCSIIFNAEDVAESFYLATNERTYEGRILVCREPERVVGEAAPEMPGFA